MQSYGRAINISEILRRLPALVIALWLGIISMSMIPQMNIVEGGILFLLFLVSCLLIDSIFNPKKIRNPQIAKAIRTFGYKNYALLILVHFCLTIIIAAHLSLILMKGQILLIIVIGLFLNAVSSRYLSRSRSKSLSQIPNVTRVVGGIFLPMVAAFFVVGEHLDLFSISIISGIAFIYMGLGLFNQSKSDLEVAPLAENNSSIEWEAVKVAEELGLSNSKAKEIGIQLYNIRNEEAFKKIPADKCFFFLPHCLRTAERCKGTYNDEGLQCKHCTKDCKINILTRIAEQLGYKSFVVPGGAMVFNIAKKYQPQGVVAVACLNELQEGTGRTEVEYRVPFQIIPLRKDGCVNTDVSIDDVVEVLSTQKNVS